MRKRGISTWLEPDDTRIRGPIVITGDPPEARDGEAAVVSITSFPEFTNENPAGELVSVLGRPGDPKVEVAKLLVREQIAQEHSEQALQEAEAVTKALAHPKVGDRVDLRAVPLPTIDPGDARDHDDAVWVERVGEGYRLWVAIADVSEAVTPGSALDQEALARGCTLYLPDRAIPMLPAALTADVCSLLPEQDRLCLCLIADLDQQAHVKRFDLVEGVMRSVASLTYGGVARALGFSAAAPQSAPAEALKRELVVIDELARKLRRRRLRRGALDLDLPEARVFVDEPTGAPIDIVRRATDEGTQRAYQIVEELMVLANELVARWLSQRESPAIYRVHGKPDEEKLERLVEAAATLDLPVELDQLLSPVGLTQWLRRMQEHPRRAVLQTLLLRALKQAYYDITNIGHFGLASEAYLHFTSPIRRYPDLEVHRAVKHLLRGGAADTTDASIESLRAKATASSVRERATLDVEREVVDLYRTLLMAGRIGERFDATVVAITGGGLYVTLDHPFVDVLVRYDALGPDNYEASEDQLRAVGLRSGDTLRLGDRILVQIEDAAVLRRTVYARRVLPAGSLAKTQRRGDQRPHGVKRGGRGAFAAARAAARPKGSKKSSKRKSGGHSTRRRGSPPGKRRG